MSLNAQMRLSSLALLLAGPAALALPFNEFDARSMGLGGAGVASSSFSAALLHNPGLLGLSSKDDTASFSMPFVGVRLADPDNMQDEAKRLSDESQLSDLVKAADLYVTAAKAADSTALNTQRDAMLASAPSVRSDLARVANKSVYGEVGAGMAFAFPNRDGWNWGVSVKTHIYAAAKTTVASADLALLDYAQQNLSSVTTAINANSAACTTSTLETCSGNSTLFQGDTLRLQSSEFHSEGQITGVVITEMGPSFAQRKVWGGREWGLGFTPKVQRIDHFDYVGRIDRLNSQTDFDAKDYLDNKATLNLDAGLASRLDSATTWGVSVRDLLPNRVTTKIGNTIKLYPRVRTGLAVQRGDWLYTSDLDLTRNRAVALADPTQFLSVGAEWGWSYTGKLRMGYRHDLVAKQVGTFSMGFSAIGLDFTLLGNSKELGAGLQFAATW